MSSLMAMAVRILTDVNDVKCPDHHWLSKRLDRAHLSNQCQGLVWMYTLGSSVYTFIHVPTSYACAPLPVVAHLEFANVGRTKVYLPCHSHVTRCWKWRSEPRINEAPVLPDSKDQGSDFRHGWNTDHSCPKLPRDENSTWFISWRRYSAHSIEHACRGTRAGYEDHTGNGGRRFDCNWSRKYPIIFSSASRQLQLQPGVLELLHMLAEHGIQRAIMTRNSVTATQVLLDKLQQELNGNKHQYPHLEPGNMFSEVWFHY